MLTDKLIHIHIPRTAGTTFRLRVVRSLRVKILDYSSHKSYSHYQTVCNRLGYEVPPAFAVIRNPWEWYVSMWGRVNKIKRNGWCGGTFEQYMECIKLECIDHWNFKPLMNAWNVLEADKADFVARYESLYYDIPRFIKSIIPSTDELTIKLIFMSERFRKTEHHKYQTYYNDKTQQWVADWDSELISRFSYSFR